MKYMDISTGDKGSSWDMVRTMVESGKLSGLLAIHSSRDFLVLST